MNNISYYIKTTIIDAICPGTTCTMCRNFGMDGHCIQWVHNSSDEEFLLYIKNAICFFVENIDWAGSKIKNIKMALKNNQRTKLCEYFSHSFQEVQ